MTQLKDKSVKLFNELKETVINLVKNGLVSTKEILEAVAAVGQAHSDSSQIASATKETSEAVQAVSKMAVDFTGDVKDVFNATKDLVGVIKTEDHDSVSISETISAVVTEAQDAVVTEVMPGVVDMVDDIKDISLQVQIIQTDHSM
jgi:hypothetical protein